MERLLQLIGLAMAENKPEDGSTWFITFFGHVNELEIKYYRDGWKRGGLGKYESTGYVIDTAGIERACEFIEQRLKNVPQS
jgi:hypothetical protein